VLHKRGRIWHYEFSLDGQRYRGSTATSDYSEAKKIAERIKAQNRLAKERGKDEILSFPQCVALYIKDGGEQRFLAPILRHFAKHKVKDINGLVVREAAKILYPDAEPSTWNRQVLTPVKAIINKAADSGLCKPITIKRFPEPVRQRPAASREWIDKFVEAALAMDMPETAAIVRFMFETGARVSEACRLEWKDVNLKDRRVYLERTKTVARTAFIGPVGVSLLSRLPIQQSQRVFGAANRSTVSKRIGKVIALGKLDPFTSHELGRHGFYTEMIVRNRVDPKTAARLGGSKSVRLVMETYVSPDEDRHIIDEVFGERKA
jgi:integrase